MRAIDKLALVLAIRLLLSTSLARAQNANIAGNLSVGTLSAPTVRLNVDDSAQPTWKGQLQFSGTVLTLKSLNAANDTFPVIQWLDPNGVRAAYMGWGTRTLKRLDIGLENGYTLAISGGR